ncbi:hypothetical protein [Nesterenkonia alkaliphila]|uniref:Uncharacterized protein n=1 Tax=Nesterenkonia alkaliphila TaxID=1463631 RepID=A0A7K1UFC1_9MICC|nr:hypothetical protein [Nesterenkonia alkaliphila]MVT25076.1 hypothetical protein [Nesterenkonia alkaliphila]
MDFDNDEGATIATLYIERTEHGYAMRIDQHSDDYLLVTGALQPPALEPAAYEMDEEYRAQQMMLLHEGLHEVRREYAEHVFFYDEGDPFAFDPGNYVFMPAAGRDGSCFAIEERYARGTDWEDDERVPIGWDWVEKGPALMPDGSTQMRPQAEGTSLPSDIERLIDRARTWAREQSERAAAEEAVERELFQARLREGRGRSI